MITAILTLTDLIGTSDYTDYIARTTTVGTTLIGDGIEAGEIITSSSIVLVTYGIICRLTSSLVLEDSIETDVFI